MDDDRLPTDFVVRAALRECDLAAVPAMLLHKGEANSGTIVVKLNLLDGTCQILTQARDGEGRLGWMSLYPQGPKAEREADAYIERSVKRDPDIWVVEIEHRQGWHPFQGPVIG